MTEAFIYDLGYMTRAQVLEWLGELPEHESLHKIAGVLHRFFNAGDGKGFYAIDDTAFDDSPIGRSPVTRLLDNGNGFATVRAEWLSDDDDVIPGYLPGDIFDAFDMRIEVINRVHIGDERLDEITVHALDIGL